MLSGLCGYRTALGIYGRRGRIPGDHTVCLNAKYATAVEKKG